MMMMLMTNRKLERERERKRNVQQVKFCDCHQQTQQNTHTSKKPKSPKGAICVYINVSYINSHQLVNFLLIKENKRERETERLKLLPK